MKKCKVKHPLAGRNIQQSKRQIIKKQHGIITTKYVIVLSKYARICPAYVHALFAHICEFKICRQIIMHIFEVVNIRTRTHIYVTELDVT